MNLEIPAIIHQLCIQGAFIVGSKANLILGDDIEADDWDLIVPFERWQYVAMSIPDDARPNKFGGWSMEIDGHAIDIWPDTVHNYLTRCINYDGSNDYVVDIINKNFFSKDPFNFN